METLFVVEIKGIYRHGVVGITHTFDKAVEIAKTALKAERDDYHDMVINEHVPNVFSEEKHIATVSQDSKREVSVRMENPRG